MVRIPLPVALATAPFTTQEGHAAGLNPKRMRGRDLQRPFRGVRAPSAEPLPFLERCRAYHTRMPQHAFFCGPTAARIIGVPLPWRLAQSPEVHVGVPPGNRAPTGRGVRGHTFALGSDDIREWGGLRVSSPESTWCTLGALLGLPDLVAAGDFLLYHRMPLSNRKSLSTALQRFVGRRGLRALKAAIPLLNDRSESPQESILRVIAIQGGVRGLTANLPIRTSGGFRYRADLAIADRKFILEYQSRFHDGSKEFRADMTRISRLEADGWRVMQVNRDDLDDPDELLYRIRTALRTHATVP